MPCAAGRNILRAADPDWGVPCAHAGTVTLAMRDFGLVLLCEGHTALLDALGVLD